jgi:hemoglobin
VGAGREDHRHPHARRSPPVPLVGNPALPRADGARARLSTLYDRVGGDAWFASLVDRFYAGVAADPVLRPLYPDDLEPSRDRLCAFLIQYWGGPGRYSEARGHPRLRMRHMPFAIGSRERDAWWSRMAAAVRDGGLSASDEAEVRAYFEQAATFLINSPT